MAGTSAIGDADLGSEKTSEIPAVTPFYQRFSPWRAVRRSSKRTRITAGVSVVVLAAAGAGGYWIGHGSSSTASATGTTPGFAGGFGGSTAGRAGFPGGSGSRKLTSTTELVAATTGNMKQTVSVSGTLEPTEDSDLTFGASGKVTSVRVAAGDTVKKGQILATIGTAALQDDVNEAEETLTSAQAALTTARDDDAEASVIDQDEDTVSDDQTAVTDAKDNLSSADLRATFSGEIASVNMTVGDEVTGSSSSGSSADGASGSAGSSSYSGLGGDSSTSDSSSTSDDIEVVSTGSFSVSADVDDTQISEVKKGQSVTITPSSSTSTLKGTVSDVGLSTSSSSSDSSSSSVADYPVTISVSGVHPKLEAGTSATVAIVVENLKHVVEIPTAAISYTSGDPTVTVKANGSKHTQKITTGATLGEETQVTSGLKAGQKVVEKVQTFSINGKSAKSLFGGSSSFGSSGFRSGRFGGSGSGGAPSGFGGFGGSGGNG